MPISTNHQYVRFITRRTSEPVICSTHNQENTWTSNPKMLYSPILNLLPLNIVEEHKRNINEKFYPKVSKWPNRRTKCEKKLAQNLSSNASHHEPSKIFNFPKRIYSRYSKNTTPYFDRPNAILSNLFVSSGLLRETDKSTSQQNQGDKQKQINREQ